MKPNKTTCYRVQPAGKGIDGWRSTTSNDELDHGQVTLEICSNPEALCEFCGFDATRIESGLENEAAEAWYDEITNRLEGAGL